MFGFFRLYLAVIVAFYHYFALPVIGLWAVVSFFVLSGFLMTTIMNDSYGFTAAGMKKYAINRWLRLFPSYYFVAVVSVLVMLALPAANNSIFLPDTMGEIIANLTMIFPSFYPIEYIPRIVTPTWALTLEIYFYALIAIGISRSARITILWVLFSLGYLIYGVFVSGGLPGLGYGNVLNASLPFSLGALIYHFKQQIFDMLTRLKLTHLPTLAVLFVANQAAILIGDIIIGEEAWKIAFFGAYVNLALSCAAIVALFYTGGSPKARRVDSILGQYSYPVYLCHPIGAILADRLLGITEHAARGLVFFLIAVGFCFILSMGCVYLIDNNVEEVRKRIKRRLPV